MASQPIDHPVLQVFGLIRLIDHGVHEQIAECLPETLTVPQYELLRVLDMKGEGLSPAEIAQILNAPKSVVTGTLQRLEAAGLIRIDPCPEDGRKKQVWVTAKGMEVYVAAVAAIRPKMDRLREAFTLEEFREAVPFLKALRTWFSERDWADRADS
ncbi:MarR family transcriptional regulator [Phenylobacterium sp. LjRoot219]|uniref:MarR family winged helix-turn-helix transcriptional regulator n=1 Tax=Phenylobacterium sp. LjRoot219 TaxID=3342283 RepID=UPI003ECF549C